jgi:hypothetical protein
VPTAADAAKVAKAENVIASNANAKIAARKTVVVATTANAATAAKAASVLARTANVAVAARNSYPKSRKWSPAKLPGVLLARPLTSFVI